jgi:hypothetical protein
LEDLKDEEGADDIAVAPSHLQELKNDQHLEDKPSSTGKAEVSVELEGEKEDERSDGSFNPFMPASLENQGPTDASIAKGGSPSFNSEAPEDLNRCGVQTAFKNLAVTELNEDKDSSTIGAAIVEIVLDKLMAKIEAASAADQKPDNRKRKSGFECTFGNEETPASELQTEIKKANEEYKEKFEEIKA